MTSFWDKIIHHGESQEKQAQMLWERAQKYFEGKLYNRALKDLTDAITLQPSYGKEAMDLMQAFLMQGNDEQALSVGLAMLKLDPNNHELMNKLGNALRKLGSFSRAKKLYTMALKINPRYADAKYNLAACSFGIVTADGELSRQTRVVEGYNEYRRYGFLGERAEFYPVPNQKLGEDGKPEAEPIPEDGEEEQDEDSQAQMVELMARQLKEDITSSQGAWEAEYNMGLFYDVVNLGELAAQHLTRAHELAPERPEPAANMAVVLAVHKGDLVAAETVLLKNLEEHPYDRTTVLNLAVLYRKQNKQFQTLKYYVYLGDLLAKSLGEFDLVKAEEHAQDLFSRRKYLEAIPFFENLAKEKQEAFWYEKLAVMFFNQKKEDLYVRTLKDLLKLQPDNKDAAKKVAEAAARYDAEAREKAQKGSRRQAIQLFEKAVKIEETAERWVELAQLYEDEGEEILAGNALKKWKALTGGGESETKGKSAKVR